MSKKIALINSSDKYAIVDDQDYERLNQYKWQAFRSSNNPNEYYAIRWDYSKGKKRMKYMHREIFGLRKGERSRHLNGKGLDNRRSNLKKLSYEGVIPYGDDQWMARIKVQGKFIQLCIVDDKEYALNKRAEAKALVESGHPDKIKDIIIPMKKSSKYKGVTWNRKTGKWKAYTYIRIDLGEHNNEERAHEIVEGYKENRKKLR